MSRTNKTGGLGRLLNKINLNLRPKLIIIFLVTKVVPLALLTVIALTQIRVLGNVLRDIAVQDAERALNDGSRENLERLTTDLALEVAAFLDQRDNDIHLLADLPRELEVYKSFSDNKNGRLVRPGEWVLSDDAMTWVEKVPFEFYDADNVSTNIENDDILYGSSFRNRPPEFFEQYLENVPLYDEITFIDLNGNELIKYTNPDSAKIHYPLNPNKVDISDNNNTYIRAENYWEDMQKLERGEIYVSDVIGAYVGTDFIGMLTPGVLLSEDPGVINQSHPRIDELRKTGALPTDEFVEYARTQAFAGLENPVGQRFEGIIRWGTPVYDGDVRVGYITMALNHDHIMEFVDYVNPMHERYTLLPSPQDGNYAFIWDYKSRSICHPRHHSIVGYNPITGEPQVPWLEGTIKLERDYINGGFKKEEFEPGRFRTIPILDADGNTIPADDTPFYLWASSSGFEWLEANPQWEMSNLSKIKTGVNWWEYDAAERASKGTSWGEFYAKNENNREILPQFGERVLRDPDGNAVKDADGNEILDYQSRDKTPARALTAAGYVGLDGRYLNNAPQCTGWMNLTENGGSGSFYILWSGIYKPTTAGAIAYYTGQYSPEVQGTKRGFAFVTIGAGIEDFTAPAYSMRTNITNAINTNMTRSTTQLALITLSLVVVVILMAILLSSYLTGNIKTLLLGISRFSSGERQFRIKSEVKDEFGVLANSFDDMADNIVRNEKAEEESRAKSNFLARMSHEIRTPMNAILGMAELAMREDMPETAMEYTAAIKQAGVNLLDIINDVLDFSKIESGQLDVQSDSYSFPSLVSDVINIIKARALDVNLRFDVEIDCQIPSILIGDEVRMRQILLNIISNAVKYTDHGFVSFKATYEFINAEKIILKFTVEDSGIGIKEEDLDLLFSEFVRFDLDKNRSVEGTGLGLSITHNFIKAMGGDIAVKSEYGEGTIFDVTIPQGIGGVECFAYVSDLINKKVLIYDDSYSRMDVLASTLMDLHVDYVLISDVIEFHMELAGGAYAFAFISKELYDNETAILSEVNVNTEIILIAGFGEQVEERNVKLLTTPIYSLPVANILNGISDSSNRDFYRKFAVGFTAPEAKILVVDDISMNLVVARGLMLPYNMQIDLCENAKESFDAMEKTRYDIIFMDHMMPDMDGIEAVAYIKKMGLVNINFANIPIIALTANAIAGMKEMFLEHGFSDFLSKPIDTDLLGRILEKWIPDEKKVAANKEHDDKDDSFIIIEGIDTKTGITLTGGTEKGYINVLGVYCNNVNDKLEEIRKCMENRDIPLLTTHVHALKSASANIGAKDISEAAGALEEAGLKDNTGYIDENLPEFINNLNILINNIQNVLSKNETAQSDETFDIEDLKEKLTVLKEAFGNYDADKINEIIDILHNTSFSPPYKEHIDKILQHNITFDYDEAIAEIDELL
ncbi:MAG: ATP-binding protein [Oscillospiraceae bacterium]|nr:ATP-binding protein [Oscillospiraceae bacterium]